jgi:murein DD-endopeptidase MepM/ murein hydrolase activator NlpD
MRNLIITILVISSLYSAKVIETNWREGELFTQYIQRYNIPKTLLDTISQSDKILLLEIQSGIKFFELKDNNGNLLQALIPIGDEMQVQITKNYTTGEYKFDIIPTIFIKAEYKVLLPITKSPSVDINREINYGSLALYYSKLFKNRKNINFKKLQKGDMMAFFYTQKSRLGKPISDPIITSAMLETHGKKHFVFVNENGEKFSDTGKVIKYKVGSKKIAIYDKMRMPLRHIRITSPFTYKRYHPILHIYRPHLGIDFGARKGTPIMAVSDGRVIYSGWMGGYGKVIKISHGNGFVSLYAHQSRLRARLGNYVKKGEVIGYVGSTGRSTGSHLHFGLYKRGKAVNPAKYIRIATQKYKEIDIFKTKVIKIKGIQKYKNRLLALFKNKPTMKIWNPNIKNYCEYKGE